VSSRPAWATTSQKKREGKGKGAGRGGEEKQGEEFVSILSFSSIISTMALFQQLVKHFLSFSHQLCVPTWRLRGLRLKGTDGGLGWASEAAISTFSWR
jgi:hypothetical protein